MENGQLPQALKSLDGNEFNTKVKIKNSKILCSKVFRQVDDIVLIILHLPAGRQVLLFHFACFLTLTLVMPTQEASQTVSIIVNSPT